MTIKELKLKKHYKTDNTNTMILTKHPVEIVDGLLHGCEIILENNTFRVWTQARSKAIKIANQYKLKVHLMYKEAEIWIPLSLADELLIKFGARLR